ncbi:MAG: nucleotidyltransferase family protein [Pseudanabaena sp. M165S2SP1A06QC]|nr:nucleotidyltransferase family protein [Pseudanabaena sp. M165S2SP1A06QC]
MRRDEVLEVIHQHQEELQKMGVRSLDLFGSVARDEGHLGSDVDVLVDLSRPTGLIKFIRIQHYLQDLLGCKVDLGTRDMLKQTIREIVLKEVVSVF